MVYRVVHASRLRHDGRTLEDLPNEIISLIIEWLSPEETITLGCVSQRLNSLSFASYFLYKIQPYAQSAHISFSNDDNNRLWARYGLHKPFHALRPLSLALFEKRRVESVSLYFRLDRFVEEANYVQRYFRSRPQLHSLLLILPGRQTLNGRSNIIDLIDIEVYDAFVGVLKSLHCISQLKVLEIKGSIPIPQSRSVLGPQEISLPMHVITVSLRDCDCLSSPSLLDWSIHALNTMPIWSITLDGSMLRWHDDRIQMPFISDMKIYYPAPSFNLGSLLSRHPTITYLLVYNNNVVFEKDRVSLNDNALPNLARLHADMDYINVWLAQDSVMPNLHSVTALIPRRLLDTFHRVDRCASAALAKEMLVLVAKHPNITTLNLPLCQLMSGDFFPAEQDLSHIRDLQIGVTLNCRVPTYNLDQFVSAVKLFTGVKTLQVQNSITDRGEWEKVKPKLAEQFPQLIFKIQ